MLQPWFQPRRARPKAAVDFPLPSPVWTISSGRLRRCRVLSPSSGTTSGCPWGMLASPGVVVDGVGQRPAGAASRVVRGRARSRGGRRCRGRARRPAGRARGCRGARGGTARGRTTPSRHRGPRRWRRARGSGWRGPSRRDRCRRSCAGRGRGCRRAVWSWVTTTPIDDSQMPSTLIRSKVLRRSAGSDAAKCPARWRRGRGTPDASRGRARRRSPRAGSCPTLGARCAASRIRAARRRRPARR